MVKLVNLPNFKRKSEVVELFQWSNLPTCGGLFDSASMQMLNDAKALATKAIESLNSTSIRLYVDFKKSRNFMQLLNTKGDTEYYDTIIKFRACQLLANFLIQRNDVGVTAYSSLLELVEDPSGLTNVCNSTFKKVDGANANVALASLADSIDSLAEKIQSAVNNPDIATVNSYIESIINAMKKFELKPQISLTNSACIAFYYVCSSINSLMALTANRRLSTENKVQIVKTTRVNIPVDINAGNQWSTLVDLTNKLEESNTIEAILFSPLNEESSEKSIMYNEYGRICFKAGVEADVCAKTVDLLVSAYLKTSLVKAERERALDGADDYFKALIAQSMLTNSDLPLTEQNRALLSVRLNLKERLLATTPTSLTNLCVQDVVVAASAYSVLKQRIEPHLTLLYSTLTTFYELKTTPDVGFAKVWVNNKGGKSKIVRLDGFTFKKHSYKLLSFNTNGVAKNQQLSSMRASPFMPVHVAYENNNEDEVLLDEGVTKYVVNGKAKSGFPVYGLDCARLATEIVELNTFLSLKMEPAASDASLLSIDASLQLDLVTVLPPSDGHDVPTLMASGSRASGIHAIAGNRYLAIPCTTIVSADLPTLLTTVSRGAIDVTSQESLKGFYLSRIKCLFSKEEKEVYIGKSINEISQHQHDTTDFFIESRPSFSSMRLVTLGISGDVDKVVVLPEKVGVADMSSMAIPRFANRKRFFRSCLILPMSKLNASVMDYIVQTQQPYVTLPCERDCEYGLLIVPKTASTVKSPTGDVGITLPDSSSYKLRGSETVLFNSLNEDEVLCIFTIDLYKSFRSSLQFKGYDTTTDEVSFWYDYHIASLNSELRKRRVSLVKDGEIVAFDDAFSLIALNNGECALEQVSSLIVEVCRLITQAYLGKMSITTELLNKYINFLGKYVADFETYLKARFDSSVSPVSLHINIACGKLDDLYKALDAYVKAVSSKAVAAETIISLHHAIDPLCSFDTILAAVLPTGLNPELLRANTVKLMLEDYDSVWAPTLVPAIDLSSVITPFNQSIHSSLAAFIQRNVESNASDDGDCWTPPTNPKGTDGSNPTVSSSGGDIPNKQEVPVASDKIAGEVGSTVFIIPDEIRGSQEYAQSAEALFSGVASLKRTDSTKIIQLLKKAPKNDRGTFVCYTSSVSSTHAALKGIKGLKQVYVWPANDSKVYELLGDYDKQFVEIKFVDKAILIKDEVTLPDEISKPTEVTGGAQLETHEGENVSQTN